MWILGRRFVAFLDAQTVAERVPSHSHPQSCRGRVTSVIERDMYSLDHTADLFVRGCRVCVCVSTLVGQLHGSVSLAYCFFTTVVCMNCSYISF